MKMRKNTLRWMTRVMLLVLLNAFLPLHTLVHTHKDAKDIATLHIKKHENLCCKATDVLHLDAELVFFSPFQHKTLLIEFVSLGYQSPLARAIQSFNNKAPPVA